MRSTAQIRGPGAKWRRSRLIIQRSMDSVRLRRDSILGPGSATQLGYSRVEHSMCPTRASPSWVLRAACPGDEEGLLGLPLPLWERATRSRQASSGVRGTGANRDAKTPLTSLGLPAEFVLSHKGRGKSASPKLPWRMSRKRQSRCPGPILRSVSDGAESSRRMGPGLRCAAPGRAYPGQAVRSTAPPIDFRSLGARIEGASS